MLDVMVFTPVYRLEPETVTAIMALDWDGPLTLVLQRDNPHADEDERVRGVRNHLHQYQRGREMFLQGRYDAMLVIESDIIPPPDTLQRLAALDCDIAYGCYMFQSSPVVNVFREYYPGAANVGESLTVSGGWEKALRQGVVNCSGGGLGCVLIRRHVLEALDFRTLETLPPRIHCDSWFTVDAYKAGYSMKADTGVICGHKLASGTTVWPPGLDYA